MQEKIKSKLLESSRKNFQQSTSQAVKKQAPNQKADDERELNLSFCGCGFLGIYHVGVASCFHEYAPQLSMHKISGSSAGALVAVSHICGNLQLAYATTDILRVAIDARKRALGPFHPSFDINAIVREALERGLPEDVHLKARGKLHISLTRVYDGENVIINQFDSKEEVIQALICSCFIPFWSGLVAPKFKGVTYIDGGFSNNLLILDDKTVTVSPFAGETDICPQDDTFNLLQVSLSNTSFSLTPDNLYRLSHALLPPAPEVLSELCEQGFADGIRFLQRMKLISCTKCLEIRSSLLVTTNGEDMEEAFAQQVTNGNCDSIQFNANHVGKMAAENGLVGHHIRLEQQEQKMIEINGSQRRNSVVSTTSSQLVYSNSQQQQTAVQEQSNDDQKQQPQPQQQRQQQQQQQQQQVPGEVNCDECDQMRLNLTLKEPNLPQQFSDRIRDACDTVNKSLSNWIYSHRPIKYLSYLAAPYYLPVDLSLALVYRCWQQLPNLRTELIDCVCSLVEFLIAVLRRMNARSTSTMLMGDTSNIISDLSCCDGGAGSVAGVASLFGYDHVADSLTEQYEKKALLKRSGSTCSLSTTTTRRKISSCCTLTTTCSQVSDNCCSSSIMQGNAQQQQPPVGDGSLESTFSLRIKASDGPSSNLRNSRNSVQTITITITIIINFIRSRTLLIALLM